MDALADLHIWAPPLIDMRFNYRPENPLYLLLVRVYRLASAQVVENTPAYAGCKSWVPLGERIQTGGAEPVLDEADAPEGMGRLLADGGIENGFTLLAGMAANPDKHCIGVDNFSHKDSPRQAFLRRFNRARSPQHVFREGDFREYFATQHKETLGLYLFDGPHTYEDQLDGLALAEPFFGRGCLVLVDDTNWPQVREANLDFIKHSPFEYRMLLDVQTPRTGHPTFWNGVMLFERGKRKTASAAIRRSDRKAA
jgi:hypothetical protein